MGFKNAFKILISKFGFVWLLLLYTVIVGAITALLGLTFIVPMYKELVADGIINQFSNLFAAILNGASISDLFISFGQILESIKNLIFSDKLFALNSVLLVGLVFIFIYRFIMGLYELPLVKVLNIDMNSHAKTSFTVGFLASFGKSCKFVLTKMIFTIVYDSLFMVGFVLLFRMFGVSGLSFFAPFIIMLYAILLIAFRYSLISAWTPLIIEENNKIFQGFFNSVKLCFKNFGTIFSNFIITWTLLIAFNLFVGLFTLGVGLLITVPISLLFLSSINLTIYYEIKKRRYYVDENIRTPQVQ